MKYMLLIYHNPGFLESFGEDEMSAVMKEVGEIMGELEASGEWVGGEALADMSQTKVVRVQRRRAGRDRRAVRGGQGAPGGLLHHRGRDAGARRGDRRALARRALERHRAAPDHGHIRDRDVTVEEALRGRRAAGARRAVPPLRALRRVRGRRPGGAARRRACSGPPTASPRTRRAGCSRSRRGGWPTAGAARRRGATASARRRWRRASEPAAPDADDTLTLLFMCCHPALSRAVADRADAARGGRPDDGGDRGRVPRARGDDGAAHQPRQAEHQAAGAEFGLPPEPERGERLRAVLHVLYLIFNEGYTATSGPRPPARRPDPRGDPPGPPACAGCCPATARWRACSR